jgi:hypothetical protein
MVYANVKIVSLLILTNWEKKYFYFYTTRHASICNQGIQKRYLLLQMWTAKNQCLAIYTRIQLNLHAFHLKKQHITSSPKCPDFLQYPSFIIYYFKGTWQVFNNSLMKIFVILMDLFPNSSFYNSVVTKMTVTLTWQCNNPQNP